MDFGGCAAADLFKCLSYDTTPHLLKEVIVTDNKAFHRDKVIVDFGWT